MTAITSTRIDETQRAHHTAKVFGSHFPLYIEPAIYFFADRLSTEYQGGYWHFYELSDGGFYMAPGDDRFQVSSENGWQGAMTAEAFGICCCLYAYSHISFSSNQELAEVCARHFHLLREFMMDHPEARAMLSAVD